MALSDFEKGVQKEISTGQELPRTAGAPDNPNPAPQAVSSLLILNSSFVGSRDLWWVDSPSATKGYNIYRAFDQPDQWAKINGDIPWQGHFYRDATVLTQKTYTVQQADFVEQGELGKWGFKLPEVAYSSLIQGRPIVATSPDDVTVLLDGKPYRPVMVVGLDQTVWMQMDNTVAPAADARPFIGGDAAVALVNNGDVGKADYSGVQWEVRYNALTNFVDIYTTLTRTFYTVVPVGDRGEVHTPGALGTPVVNSQEVDRMDYMQREMVRRNAWLFEQVGEPAYIMFRKTRGVSCGCKGTGLGQPRTGCPSCFEIGFVGGYYGPYDILFIDPDQAATRELDEGGVKVTRAARSYLTNTPIVQDGDLIIRRNGERLVISEVVYKSPRGVILQQDFNVTLLNKGDTRYLIPVNTGLPTIFDPVVVNNPVDGGKGNGEPITDARTEPDKQWENKDPQAARTITFGRIQR
jgi:hypothetical protein